VLLLLVVGACNSRSSTVPPSAACFCC